MTDIFERLQDLVDYLTVQSSEKPGPMWPEEEVLGRIDEAVTVIRQGRMDTDRLTVALDGALEDLKSLQEKSSEQAGAVTSIAKALRQSRLVAAEAVSLFQKLHYEEGLSLDGEIILLMARVRVASGGGCGVCPLRREHSVRRRLVSDCGHPQVLSSDFVLPNMEKEVTLSQKKNGPPPPWCPFLEEPAESVAKAKVSAPLPPLPHRLRVLSASLRAEGRHREAETCDGAVSFMDEMASLYTEDREGP